MKKFGWKLDSKNIITTNLKKKKNEKKQNKIKKLTWEYQFQKAAMQVILEKYASQRVSSTTLCQKYVSC